MDYDLLISKRTEQDIDEVKIWYDEQQANLGMKFYFEVMEKLEDIKAAPQYYSFFYKNYRQLILPHFPYKIIFRIIKKKVFVWAVFHKSRNPADLLKRL